jgi:hypothetical protein
MEVKLMIVFRLLLALVITVGLGACDKASETVDPPTEEEVSTGIPAEEETGPENPRPPVEDVSVTLPELPVGGGSDGEPEDQCATASFNGSIPDGVSIKVTGIRFSAAGASVRGGDCGDDSCQGFTFTSDQSTCSVSVDASDATQDTDMLLDGECFAEDLSACDELKDYNPGSVSLNVPDLPVTETETDTGTETETETGTEETTTTDDEPLPTPTE